MTNLLQEAFMTVSTNLNQQNQDRLAQFMIKNVSKLPKFLEDELDEQRFDTSAVKVIKSETVQHLLKRVAEKHQVQYSV